MTLQVTLALFAQVLVPAIWTAWVAFGPHRSRWGLVSHAAAAAAFLLVIGLVGLWLAVPRALLPIWWLLLAAGTAFGWWRAPRAMPTSRAGWIAIGGRTFVAIGLLALAARAYQARSPVEGVALVPLAFPLRGGTFLVANGGSNTLVNVHLHTLGPEPRFRRYRGQSYAVDLVAEGSWGSRLRGISPEDPADYAAFGMRVTAPCGGTVLVATDSLPDLDVPERDREHMAGNHVILECDGAWIVLGHLMQGSAAVLPGEAVLPGDLLGLVGNTGNTDEPHLHVHAQTPGTTADPLSGEPLPILLGGRWLVRNDYVLAPTPSAGSFRPGRPEPASHRLTLVTRDDPEARGSRLRGPASLPRIRGGRSPSARSP